MSTSFALRPQFGTRRLFLWMLFVSVYAAVFSVLPATTLPFSMASCVAIAFIVIDAVSPLHYRFTGLLGISYFACGLAYAITAGWLTLELFPPTIPPKPPMPFWAGLYHLVTGGVSRDIANGIGSALAIAIHYNMTILCCTFTSVVLALVGLRRESAAKWLLLLNLPGLMYAAYLIFND